MAKMKKPAKTKTVPAKKKPAGKKSALAKKKSAARKPDRRVATAKKPVKSNAAQHKSATASVADNPVLKPGAWPFPMAE